MRVTPRADQRAVACWTALVMVAIADPVPARVAAAPPDPARSSAYRCVIEVRRGESLALVRRLFYDRGSFREEQLDPTTLKVLTVRLYRRDGQGIAFYTGRGLHGVAGVDVASILYRLARRDPARLAAITGHSAGEQPEPAPTIPLQTFSQPAGQTPLRRTGHARVDGKYCMVLERGGRRIAVWRGYILASRGKDHSYMVRNLRLVRSLPSKTFTLPAGITAKVPADLHVKLPQGVLRVEYPGDGLLVSGAPPLVRPGGH